MATKFDEASVHRPKPEVVIDANQYERLASLARDAARTIPDIGERLLEEIERANVVPSEKLPPDVVTVGSEVTYEDSATGRTQTVRIAYPAQADVGRGLISVLTPIGAGLIGLSAGQSIDWEMKDGSIRRLTLLNVTRPEAD